MLGSIGYTYSCSTKDCCTKASLAFGRFISSNRIKVFPLTVLGELIAHLCGVLIQVLLVLLQALND
jgi:hypothetical protein